MSNRQRRYAQYTITVQGALDASWRDWFSDLTFTTQRDDKGRVTTTLIGPVPDQAALRGILTKLWDLNFTLVSLHRLEEA